ncbi:sigma-54 dependent transcriptional regulator [Pseudodesulfovibrio sp. zrk46]|uniref:sigma-54-dependent transcriptional regulator n=1 Tax=Pseudodesulfovibrio sp. zrk46 TaxID=2725288 RepID=UPI0014492F71|nr:sigma-54 dependent transcriptional regulator [Pseudodesulfovibrio sp. zrk46]QJB55445.1 sigma-54-dependent Fis family transcriptional regulator [Pseudodesulfovibrio sp. zrk46]
MAKILLIDDEQMMHVLFADVTAGLGHHFEAAESLAEGWAKAESGDHDVVFLDVLLPDGNGIEELNRYKDLPGSPEVIVITSHGDSTGAATVLEQGGWEYLTKPLTVDKIEQSVRDVVTYRQHQAPARSRENRPSGIIGASPLLMQCLAKIEDAARMDVPTMIHGETGTGKELFAKAVHERGNRAARPFVTLDCAALSPTLIGSQLFGHVRGAFTGADRSRDGVIAQAHTGTLFMDEIGELPLEMQASFLRVLETGRFRPVGSQSERESDFRLVAATNKDLEEMARLGLFRSDLLYRLRGVTVTLPPLRDRLEDLELLARHYFEAACKELGVACKEISDEFWATLHAYPWPGNVRELKHAVRRALAAAQDGPMIYSRHLPTQVRIKAAQAGLNNTTMSPSVAPAVAVFPKLKDYRDKAEREYVEMLLDRSERNMKKAAEIAGVSRGYLYELLKKHGMKR